eukprot:1345914-Amorphochlora_amoeboformis.AAC.1
MALLGYGMHQLLPFPTSSHPSPTHVIPLKRKISRTQGRGQALNMRDQGLDVIIGLRKGRTWELAKEDGWVEGESLFEIEEAAAK